MLIDERQKQIWYGQAYNLAVAQVNHESPELWNKHKHQFFERVRAVAQAFYLDIQVAQIERMEKDAKV